MALSERLELDITEALSGVDQVEAAMTAAAQSFGAAIEAALAPLSLVTIEEADASVITSAIDEAVAAADTLTEPTADASEVTTAIDDAIAAAEAVAEVSGDTATLLDDVDAALAAADGLVEVTGDASDITASIDDAVASADAVVVVEGDASGLTDSIEEAVANADTSGLTAGLGDVSAAAGSAGGSMDGLSSSIGAFSGLAQASTGNAAGLTGSLSAMGPQGAAAGAGIAALAGATSVFFNNALEARTATERFERVFGELAATVDTIKIGGLNEDISSLALRIGASDDGLRVAAARVGELGIASGRTREEAAGVAQEFVAIAARLSVVNPGLGTADEIVDKLGGALSRGGRFAANLGIALTATEINARALADTGKTTAAELSFFDKSAAGAALTVEKLGTTLATDIDAGAKGAEVSMRAFRTSLDETVEAAGGPLIDPLVDAFKEAQPLIEALAKVIGVVLVLGVKNLEITMKVLGPTFSAVNTVLDATLGLFEKGGEVVQFFKDTISELIESFNSIPILPDISDPFEENAVAAGDAADATDEYGDSAAGAAEKQAELNDTLTAFLDLQLEAIGGDLALEGANDSLSEAIGELNAAETAKNKALASGKGDTEAGKKAVEDYEDALLSAKGEVIDVAEQTAKLAEQQAAANGTVFTAKDRQDSLTTSLAKTALTLAPGSALRAAIEGYIVKINNVPADKATAFVAEVEKAVRETGRLKGKLDDIPRVVTVRVDVFEGVTARGSSPISKRAVGGPVFAGIPYLIGEDGPEVFIPRTAGTVRSNAETQRAFYEGGEFASAAGGDQRPIEVTVIEAVSASATADAVSARIAAEATR